MKRTFTSFAAVLLVLWYLLSVIGFDVHTCAASGETYIATIATGFTCEDLHSNRHNHEECHSCCCSHHDDEKEEESAQSLDKKSCCTGDFQVISLTGVRACENNDYSDLLAGGFVVFSDSFEPANIPNLSHPSVFCKPRSWIGLPWNLQALYSIWRI